MDVAAQNASAMADVASALDRLLRIEGERLAQAQAQESAARRQAEAERALAEGRERAAAPMRRMAEAQQQMMQRSQEAASAITGAGNVLANVLSGKLVSAFQGLVGMVQSLAQTSAARLAGAAKSVAGGGAGGGGGGGGGGGVGGLVRMAAAAGPAGAALAAVAGAAGAAYGTLTKLAGAAMPGTATALNQAFEYLQATIGVHLIPHMVALGASVVFAADLLKDTLGDSAKKTADSGGLLRGVLIGLVKAGLQAIVWIEKLVQSIAWAILKLSEVVSHVLSWIFKKLRMKETAASFEQGAEKINTKAPKVWKMSMPSDWIANKVADAAPGVSVGGKSIGERWDSAVAKFANTSMMAGQKSGFEGVDSAYKRIQEAGVGLSPLEQEKLDLNRKATGYLAQIANSNSGIERKTGPSVVK